ncbi:PAP2 family protein [hydrothermal vent metagenome]
MIGFFTGMIIGWSMGLYKMMIGDHFLSHTLITMVLAWLIILIIAKIVNSLKVLQ